MPNGEDVFQVTIESNDLQLKVLSLGAIIQDIRMTNVFHSLVLGYPRLEPYFINSGKLGAIVGRYANRISNGKATIDGKIYSFNKNQNKNIFSCCQKMFQTNQKIKKTKTKNHIYSKCFFIKNAKKTKHQTKTKKTNCFLQKDGRKMAR